MIFALILSFMTGLVLGGMSRTGREIAVEDLARKMVAELEAPVARLKNTAPPYRIHGTDPGAQTAGTGRQARQYELPPINDGYCFYAIYTPKDPIINCNCQHYYCESDFAGGRFTFSWEYYAKKCPEIVYAYCGQYDADLFASGCNATCESFNGCMICIHEYKNTAYEAAKAGLSSLHGL